MRTLMILTAACLFAAATFAQNTQQQPPRPLQPRPGLATPPSVAPGPLLQGDAKLSYLVRQLGLKGDLEAKANALLDTFRTKAELRKKELTPDKIKQMNEEASADIAAGRTVEGEAKRQRITELVGNVDLEREFITELQAVLSPEQKAALEAAQARLAVNPTGTLTPFDVVNVARTFPLSTDQQRALDAQRAAFRKEVNGIANFDAMARVRSLDQFVKDVRSILLPDQQAAFDAKVGPMWTEAQKSLLQQLRAVGPAAPGSATQPATPGAPTTAPARPAGGTRP